MKQPGEFIDIADKAWESRPPTDERVIFARDAVREQLGRIIRETCGHGSQHLFAGAWMGMALAIADSMDPEELREALNDLPGAFGDAVRATMLSARIADHKGLDRDWLARSEGE